MIKVPEKVQSLFTDAEENYFTLMKLYDLLINAASVEEQYWLLKKALQEHFAVEASEEIEDGIKKGNKPMRRKWMLLISIHFYNIGKDSA